MKEEKMKIEEKDGMQEADEREVEDEKKNCLHCGKELDFKVDPEEQTDEGLPATQHCGAECFFADHDDGRLSTPM